MRAAWPQTGEYISLAQFFTQCLVRPSPHPLCPPTSQDSLQIPNTRFQIPNTKYTPSNSICLHKLDPPLNHHHCSPMGKDAVQIQNTKLLNAHDELT